MNRLWPWLIGVLAALATAACALAWLAPWGRPRRREREAPAAQPDLEALDVAERARVRAVLDQADRNAAELEAVQAIPDPDARSEALGQLVQEWARR